MELFKIWSENLQTADGCSDHDMKYLCVETPLELIKMLWESFPTAKVSLSMLEIIGSGAFPIGKSFLNSFLGIWKWFEFLVILTVSFLHRKLNILIWSRGLLWISGVRQYEGHPEGWFLPTDHEMIQLSSNRAELSFSQLRRDVLKSLFLRSALYYSEIFFKK